MNKMKTNATSRIASIDIMRGLTIFLMLFVNDLYEPGVPHWLVHAEAYENSVGLADLVFPGFLFMVGLSVPFAITSRRRSKTDLHILLHILWRTVSLILIGVLILNGSERINPVLTGMPKLVWLFLLYTAIFLIWNNYTGFFRCRMGRTLSLSVILKGTGGLLLIFLVWRFKSGTADQPAWLTTGWWGILGLIGWGYLAAALTYLYGGRKIIYGVLFWVLALTLNIVNLSGWLDALHNNRFTEVLDVWLGGNVPLMTLAGLVVGMILQRRLFSPAFFVKTIFLLGTLCLAAGFILRHWFIFSKIIGTPSWAMVCNGVSMLCFATLYYLIDIRRLEWWAYAFKLAGRNALTTYLAPDMIYFMLWYFGWPVLIYKQEGAGWWVIGGSLIWAALMILYAQLLSKISIRLKL